MDWKAVYEQALPYDAFLQRHADADSDVPRWQRVYDQTLLTDEQQGMLAGFMRTMRVLCLTGAWCGDCVAQCPILQRIAEAADGKIDLRFVDRDTHPDVADELRICAGKRVPVVVFLTEDFHECGRFGDRTLSRYRQMAAELGGAACSTGISTADQMATVTQEWLDEFERIHCMLRTSARLRQMHGD
jgi:thiol-disulfide isomerase/thioredoxin